MSEIIKDESADFTPAVKARTGVKRSPHKWDGNQAKSNDSAAPSFYKDENRGYRKPYDKNRSSANSPKDFQAVKENIEKKIDAFFEANKEMGLRKLVSASKLMEAGAHIGMSPKLWNPKMKPYIYPRKGNRTQIIDILKTMVFLDRAYNFLKEVATNGGRILFVGTRGDIIKEHVKNEAKRVKSFYVNQRWLGGTLTNFKTINNSINKLNRLMAMQLSDEIKKFTKKEQVEMTKETEKMGKFLGGIRTMRGLPQVLIVTDPVHEHNAVTEARKLNVPVIAFANTNANPDVVDFIIPVNSSSIKTVHLLISIMADAVAEAGNEPLSVVGKKDEEIILPEVIKKEQSEGFIRHKRFTRGGDNSYHNDRGYSKPAVKNEVKSELPK